MIQIALSTIQDSGTRQALDAVQTALNGNDLTKSDFRLFTVYESAAVTSKEFFHGLGFVPTDIIITRQIGGTITWDFSKFTEDRIYYTTSGAIDLRCLIGRI